MTLAPTAHAPGQGRQFLQAQLSSQVLEPVLDTALLLASELITNSVRHAGTEIGLMVAVDTHEVYVEVRDACLDPPAVHRERDPACESGRGMLLLNALSSSWGVRIDLDGKAVWFCLARNTTAW